MMFLFWGLRILGRWRRGCLRAAIVFLLSASWLGAQAPSRLLREYRASPAPAKREALIRFSAQHSTDSSGALVLLALGITAVERKDFDAGIAHLEEAAKRLPALTDYFAYYLGLAYSGIGQAETAASRLEGLSKIDPVSPLLARASLALASARMDSGNPQLAVAALKERYARLPQPAGDMALAGALEAAGQLDSSAYYGQRVYFGYPASKEAVQAAELLKRLAAKLGDAYPPPAASAMMERARKWFDAGAYSRARTAYLSLATQLSGAEQDLARVRAGVAQHLGGETRPAYSYLQSLSPASPEADAERLYYLVHCARSVEDPEAMRGFVERLRAAHPKSEWRLSALTWAGNYHLLRNEPGGYVPYFQACYEGFPDSPRADYCYWKIAWNSYIERKPEAARLLEDYLRRFQRGDKRSAALYFLGRLEEAGGKQANALGRYREICKFAPGSYYVGLAEERLGSRQALPGGILDFTARPVDRPYIARARLLATAGLPDLADGELRFAARTNGSSHVLALELARMASQRDAADVGVRHIKGVFPDYLSTPFGAVPLEFWRLAFPLPYRQSQQRHASVRKLDPYLVAGLIRQESEFNPRAVSSAGARGLMQILPATGRQVGRTLKSGIVRPASLFIPDLNIQIGTYYLRSLIDEYAGAVENALAAYNAGKHRADLWLTWAQYREPAEFIESIPFTETRNYVQAVLRNAWMYTRIYSINAD